MNLSKYHNLGITFTFIDYIIDRCKTAEYPVDRSNNRRAAFDYDPTLRNMIESSIISANPYDIGCMLWQAGSGFKWHQDRYSDKTYRQAAINIMINDANENNYSEFCDINPDQESFDPILHNREKIIYEKYGLVLLNTTQWHQVVNKSNIDRYIFTIGFKNPNDSFDSLYQKFKDNKLFNMNFIKSI